LIFYFFKFSVYFFSVRKFCKIVISIPSISHFHHVCINIFCPVIQFGFHKFMFCKKTFTFMFCGLAIIVVVLPSSFFKYFHRSSLAVESITRVSLPCFCIFVIPFNTCSDTAWIYYGTSSPFKIIILNVVIIVIILFIQCHTLAVVCVLVSVTFFHHFLRKYIMSVRHFVIFPNIGYDWSCLIIFGFRVEIIIFGRCNMSKIIVCIFRFKIIVTIGDFWQISLFSRVCNIIRIYTRYVFTWILRLHG